MTLILTVPTSAVRAADEKSPDVPWAPVIAAAESQGLDRDPDWLRLLHFDGNRSRIVSPGFFLAPDGGKSARAELRATIEAYFQPLTATKDQHPRCRFPARYQWLNRKLGRESGIESRFACPRLERWARFDELESISLVMISGYFGNPASSFGHIILKLNNGNTTVGLTLLDLGINYGALVPENEITPLYVLRGLFGGYEAGFSDKLYYTQDLAYSRVEFRDMWEYELDLAPEQVQLIVLHLWEVVGRKFPYYFLKENCSYRLAELLELSTGEDFTSSVDLWYAPVSAFHRLNDVDRSEAGSIIRSVRFIPSSQRILYRQFSALNPTEQRAVNALITKPGELTRTLADDGAVARRSAVLDVLLAYYQYRLVGADEEDEAEAASALREIKDEVLRLRLRLPPSSMDDIPRVTPLQPPADGSRPSRVGVGRGYSGEFGGYLSLTTSAFHYDAIGNNNLAGSELVVADLQGGYSDDEGPYLTRLDFVRARKTNLNTARIAGESRWSWQVSTGVKRDGLDCLSCLELYAAGGIGRSFPFGEALIGYAMFDSSLETDGGWFVLRPNLGLRFSPGGRSITLLEVGYERGLDRDRSRELYRLESRYSLSVDNELRLGVDRQGATEVGISFHHHW